MSHALTILTMCSTPGCGRFGGALDDEGKRRCGACALALEVTAHGGRTLFVVPDELWVRRRCQVCGGALSVTYTHTYVVQRQW